jgi:hypothetical protein
MNEPYGSSLFSLPLLAAFFLPLLFPFLLPLLLPLLDAVLHGQIFRSRIGLKGEVIF